MNKQTDNLKVITHNIPDDCIAFISEQAWAVLNDNNMIIDIQPSDYCNRIQRSSFAAIYEQVPFIDEKNGKNGFGRYTNIRDDERKETFDGTAQAVLGRMDYDLSKTYYWAIYLQELDQPNKDGLTKVFTYKAEGNELAGFGYREYESDRTPIENTMQWETKVRNELLEDLYLITLWLNKKMVKVKLRDADDGLLIAEYLAIKIPNGIDGRLIRVGHTCAKNYRNRDDYEEKRAEHRAGGHVIPSHCPNLLSNENEIALNERGIIIKAKELASYYWLGGDSDKFFSVEAYYPSKQWFKDYDSNSFVGEINPEDIGATDRDTAMNLIARMGADPKDVSWWAVYYYEAETPFRFGHTKMYTTDVNELPESGGYLAGMAISYNHGISPVKESDSEDLIAARADKVSQLDALNADDRAAQLADWRSGELETLNRCLISAESRLNQDLLSVGFYDADTSDIINGFGSELYPKAAEDFNDQLREALLDFDQREVRQIEEVKAYLATAKY